MTVAPAASVTRQRTEPSSPATLMEPAAQMPVAGPGTLLPEPGRPDEPTGPIAARSEARRSRGAGVVRMHGREFPVPDMCWRRAFPGLPPAARRARDFVTFLLEGFTRADDVVLVAGEMVANVLQHTRSGRPGGIFVIELRRWRGGVALTVIDQGGPSDPSPKSLRVSDGSDGELWDLPESGRGLLTISATATWWDWCGGHTGRTVTAVFHDGRP